MIARIKNNKKALLAAALCVLLAVLVPFAARADGTIVLSDGTLATPTDASYTIAGDTITIVSAGTFNFSGTTTKYNIVDNAAGATLNFAGGTNVTSSTASAVTLNASATLNFASGTTTLNGGSGFAGVEVASTATATITSTAGGTLGAQGADGGAGIGGRAGQPNGSILITGNVNVSALSGNTSGAGGAGIGSGSNASMSGGITISTTGNVIARGGTGISGSGANIGSGANGAVPGINSIIISSGILASNLSTVPSGAAIIGAGSGTGGGATYSGVRLMQFALGEVSGVPHANVYYTSPFNIPAAAELVSRFGLTSATAANTARWTESNTGTGTAYAAGNSYAGGTAVANPNTLFAWGATSAYPTITYQSNPANTIVTAGQPSSGQPGQPVYFTVVPTTGYQVKAGGVVATDAMGNSVTLTQYGTTAHSYMMTMPSTNVTVNVQTEAATSGQHTITYPSGLTGGVVTGVASANGGTTVTITATPYSGYQLTSGSLKATTAAGASITLTQLDATNKPNEYSFIMPYSNVTITAAYQQGTSGNLGITYASMSNGKVVGPTSANAGDTVTVWVQPQNGYRLVANSLTYTPANGTATAITQVSSTSAFAYTFTMPAVGVTINARFEQVTGTSHNITYSSTSSGTVTGPSTAVSGAPVTVTIAPTGSATLASNGLYYDTAGGTRVYITALVTGSTTEYMFTMPNEAITVRAVFSGDSGSGSSTVKRAVFRPTVTSADKRVTVYSSTSTGSSSLTTYAAGKLFTVLGWDGDWAIVSVEQSGGRMVTGYIHGDNLEFEFERRIYGRTTATMVRAYKRTNTSSRYRALHYPNADSRVRITGRFGKFWQMMWDDKYYYIPSEGIRLES